MNSKLFLAKHTKADRAGWLTWLMAGLFLIVLAGLYFGFSAKKTEAQSAENCKVGISVDRSGSVATRNVANPAIVKTQLQSLLRQTNGVDNKINNPNIDLSFWSFGTAASGFQGYTETGGGPLSSPVGAQRGKPDYPYYDGGQGPWINSAEANTTLVNHWVNGVEEIPIRLGIANFVVPDWALGQNDPSIHQPSPPAPPNTPYPPYPMGYGAFTSKFHLSNWALYWPPPPLHTGSVRLPANSYYYYAYNDTNPGSKLEPISNQEYGQPGWYRLQGTNIEVEFNPAADDKANATNWEAGLGRNQSGWLREGSPSGAVWLSGSPTQSLQRAAESDVIILVTDAIEFDRNTTWFNNAESPEPNNPGKYKSGSNTPEAPGLQWAVDAANHWRSPAGGEKQIVVVSYAGSDNQQSNYYAQLVGPQNYDRNVVILDPNSQSSLSTMGKKIADVAREKCAPQCTITANPSVINYGNQVTISWTSKWATSGSLTIPGSPAQSVGPSGSMTLPGPAVTSDYTLVVQDAGGNSSAPCSATVTVRANRPFLRVGGGDVLSGAFFRDNNSQCTNLTGAAQTASIITSGYWSVGDPNNPYGASSAQYAARASGLIGSGSKANSNFVGNNRFVRQNTKDLLFANANTPTSGPKAGNGAGEFYGSGGSGGNIPCLTRSNLNMPATNTAGNGINLADVLDPNNATYNNLSVVRVNQLVVPAGGVSVPPGTRKTVIAGLGITLQGNITYPAAYSSIDQVPNLTIVANNHTGGTSDNRGNILIQSAVTRVDANLIAWPMINPNDGQENGGRLDTCSNAVNGVGAGPGNWPTGNTNTTALRVVTCPNQLQLNGLVMARQLLWKRTYGSVGDSIITIPDTPCKIGEVPGPAPLDRLVSCAAEYVNRHPSTYITPGQALDPSRVGNVPLSTRELPPVY